MGRYAANSVIDRLFDLYLIQNHHYLLQYAGGTYATISSRKTPIRKFSVAAHLDGRTTLGTFSGTYWTKFVCFDVDYADMSQAKWATYKLTATLDELGVSHAISFSGGKGYHVEVFFSKAVPLEYARRFHKDICERADIGDVAGGKVEYRPSGDQGVKLPLGIHQKTGSYCGYCTVSNGLVVMDPEASTAHLLGIEKVDPEIIAAICGEDSAYVYDQRDASDMENAISRHRPLETYDQSESYLLSRAADRYATGLTGPGQRHKSFLLLARLFNHNGVERREAHEAITEWFAWQNPEYYGTSSADCAQDLLECVDYVYDRDLTLMQEQRDITVSFAEIDAIMRKCPQKNQKALAYAMLIHSKRWARGNGAFYMSYAQIKDAAGMDEKTARRHLDSLVQFGIVEVVARNQLKEKRKKGSQRPSVTKIKKPNVYRMLISCGESGTFIVKDGEGIAECLQHFYDTGELRSMLPRRQFEALFRAHNTDSA